MMLEKKIRRQSSQGFTLIEVLISVVILTIAMMGMFAIYTQILVEIRRAKNRTVATHMAQTMMEMVASSPYDASLYHGLTTASDPPAGNPVRSDILAWGLSLDTFPTSAVGNISAIDDKKCFSIESQSLCIDIVNIDIEIHYNNYGLERTSVLSLSTENR